MGEDTVSGNRAGALLANRVQPEAMVNWIMEFKGVSYHTKASRRSVSFSQTLVHVHSSALVLQPP